MQIIEWAGEAGACTHGTDCKSAHLVVRDLAAGVTSLWENCSRSAAGGAFPCVALLYVRD